MAGDFPRMQPVKLEGLFELEDPVDLEDCQDWRPLLEPVWI